MSTNNQIWEDQIYGQGKHLNLYPFDNVVTFLFRNYPRQKERSEIRILEVGCGAGNNLWFMAREGFSVCGIDGSHSAIEFCKNRFSKDNLKGDFLVGDFTSLPYPNNHFDLVIDRGSIVCCSFELGKQAINEVQRVLVPGGKFFFNPYSKTHTSFSSGKHLPNGMVTDITAGLTGVGDLCFYDFDNVMEALELGWSIESVKSKELKEVHALQGTVHSEWEVVARKNG